MKWVVYFSVFFLISGCSVKNEVSLTFNKKRAAQARLKLAMAHLQHENSLLAYKNLARAMEYDPYDINIQLGMALYEGQTGQSQQALFRYETLLKKYPNHSLLGIYFATFLCQQQKYTRAFAHFWPILLSNEQEHKMVLIENALICALEAEMVREIDYLIQALNQYQPARLSVILSGMKERYRSSIVISH